MRALSERICRFGYGAGTFCYNRWFKFLFNRDIVFGVDALIERGAVDAVGDSVTVNGVKRKRFIFIDAASLWTVLVGSAYHGALDSHYCHTALIAGGVSSVAVNGAGCIGFIESAVRVVGFHRVAVL